jgi:hypothetical protein
MQLLAIVWFAVAIAIAIAFAIAFAIAIAIAIAIDKDALRFETSSTDRCW